jgi:hypothetical protein
MELSYPSPIPEPAARSLMIAGLTLVGGVAWRAPTPLT